MTPGREPRAGVRIVAGPGAIEEAAAVLLGGGRVAIPTETVYGLAADATQGEAVAAVFAAKQRPRFNPLIHHVADVSMARRFAVMTPEAEALAERFWPGPLSIILAVRADAGLSPLARAGLDTIALRVPDHPMALDIIRRVGRPLAAPSANPSEHLSPVTAADVVAGLGDRVDLVVDGGRCRDGVESTIVALTGDGPVLLRPGATPREAIERVVGRFVERRPDGRVIAPGMMRRHYAPKAALRLDATDIRAGEVFLGFGPPPEGVEPALNLSERGDLREAASNLFFRLRELDEHANAIAVAPIPGTGLGEAIVDRLTRAATSPEKPEPEQTEQA